MKCQLSVGLVCDHETQTIINWEEREPCGNEAAFVYHYKFVKADSFVCKDHIGPFYFMAGTVESLTDIKS